jgi:hypothetical protein
MLTLREIVKLIFCNLSYIKDFIVNSKLFKYIFLSGPFLYKYIVWVLIYKL